MSLHKQTFLENGIYLLIWIIILVIPLFGYNSEEGIRWQEVIHFWLSAVPFIVLFIINNYMLMPLLFLKRKYIIYVLSVFVVIFVLFTLIPFDMPPPPPPQGSRPPHKPFPLKWGPILNDWLLAILFIGFNIAVRLVFKSIRDERQMKELESQNLKAELNYLKAQINPHFFMNTLNNIHALIDTNTDKAKTTVIELSKIMRYILYDTDRQTVPLHKEIGFLENYINLMRIRYPDEIEIQTVYPETIPDLFIPPLMFITLIENAFKHGISYHENSYIHTRLSVDDQRVTYIVRNSVPSGKQNNTGVGLENLRKRLILLYGDNYSYDRIVLPTEYIAKLEIPFNV